MGTRSRSLRTHLAIGSLATAMLIGACGGASDDAAITPRGGASNTHDGGAGNGGTSPVSGGSRSFGGVISAEAGATTNAGVHNDGGVPATTNDHGSGGAPEAPGGAFEQGGEPVVAPMLGRACTSACAVDLICEDDPSIPGGVCSQPCEFDSDCAAISSGSLCSGVCFEACELGDTTAAKCHGRDDFSCRLLDFKDTDTACTSNDNCPADAICTQGICVELYIACLPTCGSDDDCSGRHCNLGTGRCDDTPPTGKPIGAPCDKDRDCAGVCVSTSTGKMCTGNCSLSAPHGCGWNGQGKADAACWWTPIYNPNATDGDGAYCGQLCDCDNDCLTPTDRCISFSSIKGGDKRIHLWHRQGYCGPAQSNDTVIGPCEDGTAGATGSN